MMTWMINMQVTRCKEREDDQQVVVDKEEEEEEPDQVVQVDAHERGDHGDKGEDSVSGHEEDFHHQDKDKESGSLKMIIPGRAAAVVRLTRSLLDPELFPHTAYVKIFATLARKTVN